MSLENLHKNLSKIEFELGGGWPGLFGRLIGLVLKWSIIGAAFGFAFRAIFK